MNDIILKPCPFCGEKASTFYNKATPDYEYGIICRWCNVPRVTDRIRIEKSLDVCDKCENLHTNIIYTDSEEDVMKRCAEKWNKRV